MKAIDTTTQLLLFNAAGTAFAAVARLSPPDPEALVACGFLSAELAPTLEELDAWATANGQPRPDAAAYAAMLEAAQRFALGAPSATAPTEH